MQRCINQLVELGKFLDSKTILKDPNGYDYVCKVQNLIEEIKEPITIEEAIALTKLFGEDGLFRLAGTLVKIIETAPEWPISEVFPDSSNEWVQSLIIRKINYENSIND
jgi:hypothetical protein